MQRYAHVTAAQQRQAADLLEIALTGPGQSVTQSVTEVQYGVAQSRQKRAIHEGLLAPAVGLEPTTKRLTAARSTTELRRSEDAGSWAIAEATNVVGAGSRHRAKG